jgi:multicomponent Na+:H+ antiporter subunit G
MVHFAVTPLNLIGSLFVLGGALFLLLGAVGILRMPDVYNRMQAGTKATTMGNILTLLGLGLMMPVWLPKIAIIILFILMTNPLSSHALARAAHRVGVPLAEGSVRDILREDEDAAGIERGSPRDLLPGEADGKSGSFPDTDEEEDASEETA